MKILMISTDRKLFEPDSEVCQRMRALSEAVDQLDIIVFSTKQHHLMRTVLNPKLTLYPTNSNNRWGYVFNAIRLGKKLSKPDLVTAQDPFECGWAAWRLAEFFRAQLQLQIHTDFLHPYFIKGSVLNWFRVKILARFLLPRADHIRVVSRRILDTLSRANFKLKTKPIVLPVFVDIEKIRQTPISADLRKKYPQCEKIILMASRLTPEKNIGLAIKVFPEILRSYPRIGLVIVGSGPEEGRLKSAVSNAHLSANIIFEAWTSDLVSYYKTADLFLLTSFYEGYGRTIVEALAAGCPVVTTDVGLAGESGYNGLVIATVDHLADQVVTLLRQPPAIIGVRLPYADKETYVRQYQNTWRN